MMNIPRSLINLRFSLTDLVQGRLWLQVIIAMFLGVSFGILIGPTTNLVDRDTSELIAGWVALPGNLFLMGIQFVIIPLVVASVIRGIAAGESSENLGRLGLYSMLFFVAITLLAVVIGIVAAVLINPGSYIDSSLLSLAEPENAAALNGVTPAEMPTLKEFPNLLTGLFPKDPLATFVSGNMLQIVLSAIIIGVALVAMSQDQRKPILDLLGAIQTVCMVIVGWVLKFVPFAVFGLLASISARVGISTLLATATYVATVLIGLLALLAINLLIIAILGRTNPITFLKQSREVILLALSTSSSAAVMPLTLSTTERKLRVRSGIARFVIPLGTTINMGGTALYQGVATIFLAQVFQIEIGLSGMILIVIMATGASIGSPGTPGVGIVILATILESAGIPASGIALILGVDRILDMCRTSVNVIGDMSASIVLNRIMQDEAHETPAKTHPEAENPDSVRSSAS
ncbi:dicarboxylate/amino acid:cation symporter [Sneathiella chinensis]|uniref:Dicarboxylate/amino acid:cation symporter n=1 Tax=Sneathiella chinensis TaxID=349750 RepID=A0ABQ5U0U7_9PROT|nr:dicarboxylate/amino acid:cation symporter [Sneathiella chinensis]GLQ05046.1 dicarboxylate/amino acid:cation symporter [Sneathiella chinensis]